MFCVLEALDNMLYVPEVLEVMRCMLLCMLEAVEGICYVLEGCSVCCSVCWKPWRVCSVCWMFAGGDAMCAAPHVEAVEGVCYSLELLEVLEGVRCCGCWKLCSMCWRPSKVLEAVDDVLCMLRWLDWPKGFFPVVARHM